MCTKIDIYYLLAVLHVFTGLSHGFKCLNDNAIVIEDEHICDGIPQCPDFSDEMEDLCDEVLNFRFKKDFVCGDGKHIPLKSICNGKIDCVNGEDELFHMCIKATMYCILPNPSSTTIYVINECTSFNCTTIKGGVTYVHFKTEVKVFCAPGLINNSTDTSTCIGKYWSPNLSTCVPDKTKVMCPAIQQTKDVDYLSCQYKSESETNCTVPSNIGTTVLYICKPFYKAFSRKLVECLPNGTWSMPVKCIPECGEHKDSVTLIMHGTNAKLGEWPWSAGLYLFESNNTWEFNCGSTLVSDHAVITAAHCVWNRNPENFAVTVGNLYRDNSPLNEKNEVTRQVFKIKTIKIPDVYQDQDGNYGSDIAVLFLQGTVTLSLNVRPACLPWTEDLSLQYPTIGEMGIVAGWGLDEHHNNSQFLKFIEIPIVSLKTCIETQPWDFKKYITYTTICAGFLNGTNVCNGDSGSGMLYNNQGKWELVGVVSVSPRERGTSFCQLKNSFGLFTKVMSFIPWLYTALSNST